jgi:predicted RNase H-like HicB family nuclease
VKKYRFRVEVEPLEDGRFLAVSPDLQGCLAEGDTIAEAIENVEDAARVIVRLCLENGWPLPPEISADDELPLVKAEVVISVAG